MLDRLTKRRTTDTHPHDWRINPRRKRSKGTNSNDAIGRAPIDSIFRDVAIPYSLRRNVTAPPTFEVYPAQGHVASLLLLVECFDNLRCNVEASGARHHITSATSSRSSNNTTSWQQYIRLAVDRFKVWISAIERIVRHSAVFNKFGTGSHLHGAFTENYIPPLDVLFVWFCYLQSPPAYERLLDSNGFELLAQICFPWHILPTIIDLATLDYTPPSAARTLWDNIALIPYDVQDCYGLDLTAKASAFTSDTNDLLETVLKHSDLFRQIQAYQWLRSPSLKGTIDRALVRYGDAIVTDCFPSLEQTQQVSSPGVEDSRSIADFDMDIGMQLVLLTHRAYNDAWRMFAQVYNIHHDEQQTPPSYECIMSMKQMSSEPATIKIGSGTPSLIQCFCWVCERVKDEMDASMVGVKDTGTTLARTLSSEALDDKLSVLSDSSSSSDSMNQDMHGLSRKQIKGIKKDVAIYRNIEAKRVRSVTDRGSL